MNGEEYIIIFLTNLSENLQYMVCGIHHNILNHQMDVPQESLMVFSTYFDGYPFELKTALELVVKM